MSPKENSNGSNAAEPLLSIRGLTIRIAAVEAVKNVDLAVKAGEVHAIVGESGSGKSMLARSIVQLLPEAAKVTSGDLQFEGRCHLSISGRELRQVRGRKIGMIFQEPLVSLNPTLTIETQMGEALRLHRQMSKEDARTASIDALEQVRIGDPKAAMRRHPHEFSGGMRQRIMLAAAMLLKPQLLIADEPTTALDAVIQRDVLDLMLRLVRTNETSLLLISHDLGLVANYADRVTVMKEGQIVETGRADTVIGAPRNGYTQQLLSALPRRNTNIRSASSTREEPLLEVRDLSVCFSSSGGPFLKSQSKVDAVRNVSFSLKRGETLGIVGESGSGKTTLGRAVLKLVKGELTGSIKFKGTELQTASRNDVKKLRRYMQIVFQDPFSSLNPRMTVGKLVGEGLRHGFSFSRAEKAEQVKETLEEVGLPAHFKDRYPHELSGGQHQRVGIARAIIMKPELIVADEPAAALDLTVQAKILELLQRLQDEHGFSYLFISHDLGVVEQMASRVMVMYRGHVLEEAENFALFDKPIHPYTCQLLRSVPHLTEHGNGYAVSFREVCEVAPPPGEAFFNDGSLSFMSKADGDCVLSRISADQCVALARTSG